MKEYQPINPLARCNSCVNERIEGVVYACAEGQVMWTITDCPAYQERWGHKVVRVVLNFVEGEENEEL
ncbi:MAG: hypothetical protein A2Y53_03855 [Chloroflexi bacterium RBG_16_47_49]|nr:MAG: hypothetical protein A2Y53_03855 [Chloroflexi bacterium RBG_16_47_49]